jgi:hypothetical protein
MSHKRPNSPGDSSNRRSTSSTGPITGTSNHDLPTPDEFKCGLGSISGAREIREALAFSRALYEREEQRAASFQSKATTLVGFGALAATFASGFASVMLDKATAPCSFLVKLLAVFYALLVLSFAFAIFFALAALWPQTIQYPSPRDILDLGGSDEANDKLREVRRGQAGDFYQSYYVGRKATNNMATWVMAAESSVAFGMVCLVTIASGLALQLLLTSDREIANQVIRLLIALVRTIHPCLR